MIFNSRIAAALASVVAVGALATASHAQSSGVARPFTLKLGAFTPSDEGTRDFSGDTHFLLDATYEFGRVPESSVLYGAYFDNIFESSSTESADFYDGEGGYLGSESDTGRTSAYGVGLQARYLLPTYGPYGRPQGLRPYIGGGLGLYGVYAKESVDGFDAREGFYGGDYSHTTTGLGGKIMVGVQARSGFIGEVSYHFLPSNEGLDLSGYGFSLGYRF